MQDFNSINDILDFAIKNEEDAAKLYGDLAKKMEHPGTKKFFTEMMAEEVRHKARLLDVKKGNTFNIKPEAVKDMKLSDYLSPVQADTEMDYRKALTFAMHAEKAAFALYRDLAAKAPTDDVKNLFDFLAQEEAKHKLTLEIEYDEFVLRES